MKSTTLAFLAAFGVSALAHAITVKETDISGKTNLVAIATVSVNGKKQPILTDAAGISLYTFKRDSNNVSACAGGCLTVWPPLHVPVGAVVTAPFGTIKGNDGQPQLTLNGLALYHYDDDAKPGDAFGQYPEWDVIVVK